MIITQKIINSMTLKIIITGSLNVISVPELRRKMSTVYAEKIIFDFKEVDYISSAGLREILICRKKFSDVRIENMRRNVYETFQMVGFDEFIPITLYKENLPKKFFIETNFSFPKFLRYKADYSGEDIAVVCANEICTWKEIYRRTKIIATDLHNNNVRKGDHVAICGANSINWIPAFFAIQELGAMAVLMNFNLCAKEIAAFLNYADVTHFCYGEIPEMTDEKTFLRELQDYCGGKIQTFYSIRNNANFKAQTVDENNFNVTINADDPAVMIFTSGTTGKPKGVILSAYNILNAAQINAKDQTLRADDKSCVILPFFHIFGLVACIFANALTGSTIYLPEKIRTDNILELIDREQCTIFHSVPTMLLALINNKNFSADKLSSLRCSIISGGNSTEAQIKTFQRNMPNNHFMLSYGLSEMAPVSITTYDDSLENILHTVGKPVKNIKIKILNPDSDGVGEILVQGFNLMTGYYKLSPEEQTINAEGWLHTGDLGKLDENGYLHLTGRIKEIIIRGGENIYPSEVEAAISEDVNICDVKVIGIPHEFFGEEVCACIKIKSSTFDENSLRNSLKSRLSKFKIPSYFLIYEEFTLLGNGKIDIVALKQNAVKKIKSLHSKSIL